MIELLILLFADDVVLMSDSVIGLQTQLNVLWSSSRKLNMCVKKSNVVVFFWVFFAMVVTLPREKCGFLVGIRWK